MSVTVIPPIKIQGKKTKLLPHIFSLSDEIVESCEIQIKYAGYIKREQMEAAKLQRLDQIRIPDGFNYDDVQRRISELRKSIKQRKAPVSGDHGEPLGTFVFCRDTTVMVQKQQQLAMAEDELEQKNKELSRYVTNINYILEKGTMRLASYSPEQHTLTIYHQIGRQQLVLTQARCMTFIDNRHQRKGMHMLSDMDDCINKKQTADIKTTIRARGGLTLYLHFCLYPVLDKEGKVKEYFGFCQDISELKKAESLLREETLKAQEIENTQNKFLRNMLQEIRTPLNVVVELAAQLDLNLEGIEIVNLRIKSALDSLGINSHFVNVFQRFLIDDYTINEDLFVDGLHPNRQGYEILAEEIHKRL